MPRRVSRRRSAGPTASRAGRSLRRGAYGRHELLFGRPGAGRFDAWRDALQPDLAPEDVLVLRIEPQILAGGEHVLENDAGIGEVPELAGLLDDHALRARLDAILAAAETDHLAIEPQAPVAAPVIQRGIDQLLRFHAYPFARLQVQDLVRRRSARAPFVVRKLDAPAQAL